MRRSEPAGHQDSRSGKKGGKGGKDGGGKDGFKGKGPDAKRAAPKGGGKGDSKDGGKRGGGLMDRRKYMFKTLCTDPLAANIIGHSGATRTRLEDETGCSFWMSKRDEFYPQSQCRLLMLHADSAAQVFAAIEATINCLAEVADKDQEQNLEVETPLLGKEAGEYIYRCALPSFVRGKLIGTGGAHIKQLREDTGAKIFVDNEVYSGHQFARIIGPKEVINKALSTINDLVQEEVDLPEYDPWAAVQWFASDTAPGKGSAPSFVDPRRDVPRGRSPPRDQPRGKGGREREDRGRRDRSRSPVQQRERPPAQRAPPQGSPVEVIERMIGQFPEGALGMDHAVSCDLPEKAVGQLLGEREEYKDKIERTTGAVISVDKSQGPEHLTIMITGPLIWVYAAHCMVMQRYHEQEQRAEEERRRAAATDERSVARVEELQSQLAELQAQLAEVQRSKAGSKGGRR